MERKDGRKITLVAFISDVESKKVSDLTINSDEEPVDIGEKLINWIKSVLEAAEVCPRKIQRIRVYSKHYLEKEDRRSLCSSTHLGVQR